VTEEGGGASRTTDPAAGTSSATDVSIREYLTDLFGSRFHATWTVMAAALAFGAFAWSEVQRRLEILNHENARLLQQQERTVSQDTYAANEQQRKSEQAEFQAWRKDVDRDRTQSISREEFQRDTKTEKRAVASSGWQWVLGGVALVSLAITIVALWSHTGDGSTPATVTVTVGGNP